MFFLMNLFLSGLRFEKADDGASPAGAGDGKAAGGTAAANPLATPPAGDVKEERALRKANREAQGYRTERNELRELVDPLKAQLDDVSKKLDDEKKARELAEANALKQARIAAGTKFGLPDALTERLVGNTTEELLADAEKIASALPVKAAGGVSTSSAANPAGAQTFTKEQIKSMSPDEINKNWDQIQTVLSKG